MSVCLMYVCLMYVCLSDVCLSAICLSVWCMSVFWCMSVCLFAVCLSFFYFFVPFSLFLSLSLSHLLFLPFFGSFVCSGCPDCNRKCNIELKQKLIKCFPNMEQNAIDKVLANETGKIGHNGDVISLILKPK